MKKRIYFRIEKGHARLCPSTLLEESQEYRSTKQHLLKLIAFVQFNASNQSTVT